MLTCGADFAFAACQLRLWIRCAIFADFPFFFSVQICMEMLSLQIFATDLQQNPQLPIFNTWIFALSAVKICNTKSTLKSALFHVFSADFTHCESRQHVAAAADGGRWPHTSSTKWQGHRQTGMQLRFRPHVHAAVCELHL